MRIRGCAACPHVPHDMLAAWDALGAPEAAAGTQAIARAPPRRHRSTVPCQSHRAPPRPAPRLMRCRMLAPGWLHDPQYCMLAPGWCAGVTTHQHGPQSSCLSPLTHLALTHLAWRSDGAWWSGRQPQRHLHSLALCPCRQLRGAHYLSPLQPNCSRRSNPRPPPTAPVLTHRKCHRCSRKAPCNYRRWGSPLAVGCLRSSSLRMRSCLCMEAGS